jgi:hypothetical protein
MGTRSERTTGAGVSVTVGVSEGVGVRVARRARVDVKVAVGECVAVAVDVGEGVKVGVCVADGTDVRVRVGVSVGNRVAVNVGVGVANAKSCESGISSWLKPITPSTTANAANKKGLRSARRWLPRFLIDTAKDCSTKRALSKLVVRCSAQAFLTKV